MLKISVKLFWSLMCMVSVLASCADNAITDANQVIANHNWSYINKVKVPVKIDDNNKAYSLLMNLRHTSDYKYSNIFVLIRLSGPGMKPIVTRKEFQLAYPDGEWLGKGSGNLYTYQLPFGEDFKFSKKGIYTFEFEQNMRDNPLRDVSDVGLRVEPVEK